MRLDWRGRSASRDIEAGILDGRFQSGTVDSGWFEIDGDNSGIQVRPRRADAGRLSRALCTLATQPSQCMPSILISKCSMWVSHAPCAKDGRQRRSSSEFPTTLTLLMAIAAAAIVGLRSPSAANGIQTTL